MEQTENGPVLNDILIEAAKITPEERRARIVRCVAEGRHDPDKLPFCIAPSNEGLVRYCDRCWSVIDPHGLTWSWAPRQPEQR
jgi:hypothetical protein